MLPPEAYERAMRDAESLLQLTIDAIEVHGSVAKVTGRVARSFRGPLTLGTTLTLALQVHGPNIAAGPPSGTGSTPIESLRKGRVLEAYVEPSAQGPCVALGLCTVLDAATEAPQLPALLAPANTVQRSRWLRWIPALLAAAVLLVVIAVLFR